VVRSQPLGAERESRPLGITLPLARHSFVSYRGDCQMLVVRPEQLEVFERAHFEKMQQRIEEAIATIFPDTCAIPLAEGKNAKPRSANEHGKAVVEKGIEYAVDLGIGEASDLTAFIALALALREAPPQSVGWITSWLGRPDTAGTTKLSIIEAQLAQMGASDPALLAISTRVSAARREIAP